MAANLDALIPITVRNGFGGEVGVDAVVDTGFNDFLSLPKEVIDQLQLTLVGRVQVLLADRSVRVTPVYIGRVVWHGQEMIVQVQEADGDSLIDMELMLGSKLTVHVRNGGSVEIEPEP